MSMRLKGQDIAVSVVVVFPCLLSFNHSKSIATWGRGKNWL
jgi:hypothetical protein